MFGGNDKGNQGLPIFTEDNQFQFDPNVSPQLQLFVPTVSTINPLNYIGDEQGPLKRFREIEPNSIQQNLRISLNNNNINNNHSSFRQDGGGLLERMYNKVSTGLKLAYEEEERNNSSITCSGEGTRDPRLGIFGLGDSLKLEMEQQKQEFDRYIRVQEANLMKGIRELKQKQTVHFLNSLEKGVAKKLQEKDLEIENMNRKNKELTEKIKQLASDAQCWHYRAKYNESVANTLKNNLQQVIAQGPAQAREGFGDSEVDDAASCAVFGNGGFGNSVFENKLSKCRACDGKEVSVLLMPCRHLCVCQDCERLVDVCPVCQVIKTASVQVYMS